MGERAGATAWAPGPGLPVSLEYLPLPRSPCAPPAPAHTPRPASLAPEAQHNAALHVAVRHIAHPPLHAEPGGSLPEPVCTARQAPRASCCHKPPQWLSHTEPGKVRDWWHGGRSAILSQDRLNHSLLTVFPSGSLRCNL